MFSVNVVSLQIEMFFYYVFCNFVVHFLMCCSIFLANVSYLYWYYRLTVVSFIFFSFCQGSDLTDKASQNGELKSAPSTQMIRSHSATGSLHAPQLNPIAADILRKEPEHETFSKINITDVGMDHFFFILLSIWLHLS